MRYSGIREISIFNVDRLTVGQLVNIDRREEETNPEHRDPVLHDVEIMYKAYNGVAAASITYP